MNWTIYCIIHMECSDVYLFSNKMQSYWLSIRFNHVIRHFREIAIDPTTRMYVHQLHDCGWAVHHVTYTCAQHILLCTFPLNNVSYKYTIVAIIHNWRKLTAEFEKSMTEFPSSWIAWLESPMTSADDGQYFNISVCIHEADANEI